MLIYPSDAEGNLDRCPSFSEIYGAGLSATGDSATRLGTMVSIIARPAPRAALRWCAIWTESGVRSTGAGTRRPDRRKGPSGPTTAPERIDLVVLPIGDGSPD